VLLWLPVLPVSILLFAVRDAGIAVAACVYAVREERREKEARKTTITGHAGNITTAAAALPSPLPQLLCLHHCRCCFAFTTAAAASPSPLPLLLRLHHCRCCFAFTTAAAALPLGTARTKYVSGGGESPNFDTTHANMLTLVPDRKRDTSLLLEVWNAHIFGLVHADVGAC
jgi:hypothetical protein